MIDNPLVLLILSIVFASIPVGIWIYILFSKFEKSKKIITIVFLLGCLTVAIDLGIQAIWDWHPEFLGTPINFNLNELLNNAIQNAIIASILTYGLFASLEEIIKIYMVRVIDKKTLYITTINDAMRYAIASALGFSFIENIWYLYQNWAFVSAGQLTSMYIFRSIFTTCAHMIFSGILGYYYGVGKYSIAISAEKKITGEKSLSSRIIATLFNLPISESYRQKFILKGLLIAIGMHTAHNFILEYNYILPVVAFVALGYLYLRYLLSRKAGHLVLTTDPTEKGHKSIGQKDEQVVLELLGMWFNDKRYVDVIHVCERLLQRDPDNNVVKLFKAKAMDQIDKKNVYHQILGNVLKSKEEITEEDRNIITRYTKEKDMFAKVKEMIKTQLKKEGKEPNSSPNITNSSAQRPAPKAQESPPAPTNSQDILDKYTGDGTFKL